MKFQIEYVASIQQPVSSNPPSLKLGRASQQPYLYNHTLIRDIN